MFILGFGGPSTPESRFVSQDVGLQLLASINTESLVLGPGPASTDGSAVQAGSLATAAGCDRVEPAPVRHLSPRVVPSLTASSIHNYLAGLR